MHPFSTKERMSDSRITLYEKARDMAVEAAYEAGHLIRRNAGRLEEGMIREKNVHDLVTAVDLESQECIIRHLKRWDVPADILAEEGELFSRGNEEHEGFRWIIDPIDGTTNFAHGMPPYAVSIGLQHDGDLVAGVVLEVGRWELFTAIKNQGLFVNGMRARVSRRDTLADSLLVTGFPYKIYDHLDDFLVLLKDILHSARGLRRTGSASVDLAYVACGRFDGFFETGLMPWDLAAGAVLVAEGGGLVTNYRNETNRLFDRQVVATNGLIHDVLLEKVAFMEHIRT
jgi:myo-inositol-1(or 4)-monophosphatase